MMTKEEAIERIEHHKSNAKFFVKYSYNEHDAETEWKDIEAFDMAIEALSEPSGDLISRADAMGAVQDHFNADGFKGYDDGQKMMDRLKALPSAELPLANLKQEFESAEAVTIHEDGTLEVKVPKAQKVGRVLVMDTDSHIGGGLFYPDDAVQEWIPFTRRPMTEEEQEDYPNCTFMLDCVLPDDGDEILVSSGRFVWADTFFNDIDGCYLDNNGDIDADMAWMPLPKPYKGGDTE